MGRGYELIANTCWTRRRGPASTRRDDDYYYSSTTTTRLVFRRVHTGRPVFLLLLRRPALLLTCRRASSPRCGGHGAEDRGRKLSRGFVVILFGAWCDRDFPLFFFFFSFRRNVFPSLDLSSLPLPLDSARRGKKEREREIIKISALGTWDFFGERKQRKERSGEEEGIER